MHCLEDEVLQGKGYMLAVAGCEGAATIVLEEARVQQGYRKQMADRSKIRAPEGEEVRTATVVRMQWAGEVHLAVVDRSKQRGVDRSKQRAVAHSLESTQIVAWSWALPEILGAQTAKSI
jgi:hypothetical protein